MQGRITAVVRKNNIVHIYVAWIRTQTQKHDSDMPILKNATYDAPGAHSFKINSFAIITCSKQICYSNFKVSFIFQKKNIYSIT